MKRRNIQYFVCSDCGNLIPQERYSQRNEMCRKCSEKWKIHRRIKDQKKCKRCGKIFSPVNLKKLCSACREIVNSRYVLLQRLVESEGYIIGKYLRETEVTIVILPFDKQGNLSPERLELSKSDYTEKSTRPITAYNLKKEWEALRLNTGK